LEYNFLWISSNWFSFTKFNYNFSFYNSFDESLLPKG